jgi:hypothetical protein
MTKFLYLDFLYPRGHIYQNDYYIRVLSELGKVYVVCPENIYTNMPSNVELIENDKLCIKRGRIKTRLSSLKDMLISSSIARKIKPDYIFVASFDTIMFAIGRFFFQQQNHLYLLHHMNVDELNNKIKRFLFKTYMRRVNHMVFEDFIKAQLVKEFGIDESKVHILPHQLSQNLKMTFETNTKMYTCVGLSTSNDEYFISQVIEKEVQEELFKKSNCKVILKSKINEYDNGYLKIVKGYLSREMYNQYINNCVSVCLPFPSSYQYRMSGFLVDGLSNNKIALGSNIPIIQHYSRKYPSICKIFHDVEDYYNTVITINNNDNYNLENIAKEFEQFQYDHAKEIIMEALLNILKRD